MIDKFRKYIEGATSIMALIVPIMTLPQLINIWFYRKVEGVSIVTWFIYLVAATVWMAYGILHKDKKITFQNTSLVIINGFIVVGIIIFGKNYF